MKTRRFIAAASCAVMLAQSACIDGEVTPPSGDLQPPVADARATLPLYLNNQWAYVESLEIGGPLPRTALSVETVVGFRGWGGTTWWRLEHDRGPIMECSVRRDSVFFRRTDSPIPNASLRYVPIPPGLDTIRFASIDLWGGQEKSTLAYRFDGSLVLPFGTFDSVTVYETEPVTGHRFVEYFRPGVGTLRYEYFAGVFRTTAGSLVFYRIAEP